MHYLLVVSLLVINAVNTVTAADVMPVHVIEAREGQIVETLPLTGTVTSERTAALSSRVAGLVKSIHVDAGDVVKQGDLLLELDSVMAELAAKSSQAALNESRTALKESIRLRDEARDLATSKSIAQTTVMTRIADVDLKQASVARLEAEYRQQAEQVARHKLYAPFNGVVSRKLTEVGEWVSTGTAVINLVAVDQLRLDVQAPQDYFGLITPQTSVSVKLDSNDFDPLKAHVSAMVPVNSSNARTFMVRLHIDNASKYMIPGMSATAQFDVLKGERALLLPRDALIKHSDGRNTVWVITQNGADMIASEVQVKTGRNLSNSVIIKQGLEAGSLVVVRGNETLQDGQPVKIIERSRAALD